MSLTAGEVQQLLGYYGAALGLLHAYQEWLGTQDRAELPVTVYWPAVEDLARAA